MVQLDSIYEFVLYPILAICLSLNFFLLSPVKNFFLQNFKSRTPNVNHGQFFSKSKLFFPGSEGAGVRFNIGNVRILRALFLQCQCVFWSHQVLTMLTERSSVI